jgi:hypothetical protein
VKEEYLYQDVKEGRRMDRKKMLGMMKIGK